MALILFLILVDDVTDTVSHYGNQPRELESLIYDGRNFIFHFKLSFDSNQIQLCE